MRDTDIIGVDDDQLGVARKAEALGECLWQGLNGGKVEDSRPSRRWSDQ